LTAKAEAMLEIRVAACSERGARAANEDALVASECGPGWYAVVADGAGGHRHGAEAAQRAVHRLQACLCEATLPWNPEVLTHAVLEAHEDVLRGQAAMGGQRMHTTVVALCVDAQRGFALWSHVGDSRLYRLRQGEIDLVTRDDSVVAEMMEAGLLTPSQARVHPHKNQLLAALGIEDELEPHTAAAQSLQDGDAFLLCTDGWWGSLDDDGIVLSLREAGTPEQWLQAMRGLIDECHAPDQDNFSAIALWVADPDATRSMPL
jgi:serine/threonine protein phosphatase PrpC